MSFRSTRYVSRTEAIDLINSSVRDLSNATLGNLLDMIADSKESNRVDYFNNFAVTGEDNATLE